jgi:amino acid adenylation domain-containing protein
MSDRPESAPPVQDCHHAEASLENSLHRRFEHLAQSLPESPALTAGGCTWSYSALDNWAGAIAEELGGLIAPVDCNIAIEAARSAFPIAGILGCLKAGAAYVPIDPDWPPARQRDALAAADCKAIVGSGLLAASDLPTIDPLVHERSRPSAGFRSCEPKPGAICYVMFTSGSTGQPKGVLVTHHNVARLFDRLPEVIPIRPGDVWSQFHSLAFGFSVWEVFGALTTGGHLVVVPDTTRLEPDLLADFVKTQAINVLSLTPSALRQIVLDERFAGIPEIQLPRLVVLSGEPLPTTDLEHWFERYKTGRPALYDTYAITETAGQVTVQCHSRVPDESAAGRIGLPLSDTTVHILDDHGAPVPDGNEGEMYVAGPCLAAGYAGDAELTAARFPTITLDGTGPARVFKTGDRARKMPDGSIRFSGRADAQLKIRGHRIEPGDIESALLRHPLIADAAVTGVEIAGRTQLVAWVVSEAGAGEHDTLEFWPSVGEHQVYDSVLYHFMSAGSERMRLLRSAIARCVRGRVVFDIGTGQDALLARMCAEAGARRVYAVEVLPDACDKARALVMRLGLNQCIEVLEGDARKIRLPEPAEICTHGLTGNIGSADGIAGILNATRDNLTPDAIVLPGRCRTLLAAASLPAESRRQPAFDPMAADYLEHIYQAAGVRFDTRLAVRNFPATGLLSDATVFEDLDLEQAVTAEGEGSAVLKIDSGGLFDGFLLWTRLEIADAELDHFEHQDAWLPVFIPMTDDALELVTGDRIEVNWQTSLSADGLHPDYTFRAMVHGARCGNVMLEYQSEFNSKTSGSSRLHTRLYESMQTDKHRLSIQRLRAHLGQHIPEYMVPAQFRFIDKLPLNASGKLDRAALSVRTTPTISANSFSRQSDPLAGDVSKIWQEALGVDQISAQDNFFELGGDSIAAVQVTTALQRLLDEPVRIVALFDAPAIGTLCDYLRQHHGRAVARRYADGSESADLGT